MRAVVGLIVAAGLELALRLGGGSPIGVALWLLLFCGLGAGLAEVRGER